MRMGGVRFWLAFLAAGMAGGVGACARQGMPPGGPEDRRPPVVVATVPDTFAVLTEPFRGPVEFIFDERVSERVGQGTMDQAVVVSPRTGNVRVSPGRRSISVDMAGGFKPGLVYRVTLQPVIQDLFGNTLLAPFELVFSTGGDFNPSAVAGRAWDRVTGQGVDALTVQALPVTGDSIPQVGKTDTAGVYVLRYVPQGEYRVVAFQDRNRNGAPDLLEMQGSSTFAVTGADTLFLDVPVLQPDTSAPRLTGATVLDSVTVLLTFDDYLDPQSAAGLMGITLTQEETGALVPAQILHEGEYNAMRAQLVDSFARLDSAVAAQKAMDDLEDIPLSGAAQPADSGAAVSDSMAAPGDSLGTPGDSVARPPAAGPQQAAAPTPAHPVPPELPPLSGGGSGATRSRGPAVERLAPDGRPLPARRLVLRLGEFLVTNAPYKIFAGSVVNIAGTGGGGGEAPVIREPPPPDTTAVQDSSAVSDSAAVPPDTSVVQPDSATVPPDTTVVPPDTTGGVAAGRGALLFLPERRR